MFQGALFSLGIKKPPKPSRGNDGERSALESEGGSEGSEGVLLGGFLPLGGGTFLPDAKGQPEGGTGDFRINLFRSLDDVLFHV